jgi:polar amino acid transport system substrate-binding protein
MTLFRELAVRAAYVPHLLALAAAIVLSQGSFARADDTLVKIKKTGKTTVGTEAAFPPFEFVKDGKIVGFGKDILDYVIADLGVTLNQIDVPYEGLFPGLIAGKFDFIATTLLLSADTRKFAFTYPFAEGSSSIMKRKGDARIKGVADLNGLVVGAQVGTGSVITLRELDAKFKSEGKPGFELKLFTSGPEGFLALANRQIDAVVSLLPTLKALASKQPKVYEVVGLVRPEKREFLGWAARAEDKPLRDYLSVKIKELRDNGKLYEWQEKWFGFRMELPDSGYLPEGAI